MKIFITGFANSDKTRLIHTLDDKAISVEKNSAMVKKYFLVLENGQKIFSQYIQINNISLIIVLIFSKFVRLGMGDLILKNIIKKYIV
jgi:hypothetical protein